VLRNFTFAVPKSYNTTAFTSNFGDGWNPASKEYYFP